MTVIVSNDWLQDSTHHTNARNEILNTNQGREFKEPFKHNIDRVGAAGYAGDVGEA